MHKFVANYINSTMTLFLCLSFCLLASLHSAAAELQTLHHQLGGESLSLLVVGDWGRRGAYNQSRVALQVLLSFLSPLDHFHPQISTYLQIFIMLHLRTKIQ